MPDVTLVAIEDFSYATRRLKVNDTFTVREGMAKVLVGIKKAEYLREIGKVAPPPRGLVEKVITAIPVKPEVEVEAKPAAPKRRRTARKSTAKK